MVATTILPPGRGPILPFNLKQSRLANPTVRADMRLRSEQTGSKVRFAHHLGTIL
jgi:hypothetical protein